MLIWSIQGKIYILFCHRFEGVVCSALTSCHWLQYLLFPLKLSTAKHGLEHILGNTHSLMVVLEKI